MLWYSRRHMKNIPLLLITLGGTIAFIFGVSFLFSKQTAPVELTTEETTAGARHVFTGEESPEATSSAMTEEDATLSAETDQTKSVTIVEFSDFQCPACKAAYPLKEQLFTNFPGEIEFVFRHYPLTSIHPNALLAAQAAESASQQGKFWEMHDLLFERQTEWEALTNDEARSTFLSYAQEIGLDEQLFSEALESDTVKSLVQQDINSGDQLKVNATPTFFVNGKKVSAPDLISTVQSELSL